METASPSLRQAARNLTHRVGLPAFWQWWTRELAPLVPERPRNALRRRRLRPMLAFDAEAATLWAPGVVDGTVGFREAARVSLSGDPAAVLKAGRAAIDALPRVAYGGAVAEAKVVIALPASQVLRKTLTLPAAVEENLTQTLAYDLDRHTPFKPDEVYFDAVVVGRDSAKKEIRVDWAAALRTVVDQACRRAESWGAIVAGVTAATPAARALQSGPVPNLLPADRRPDTSTARRLEIGIPLALIAAIALLAAALPIWQKRGYAISLTQQTEQGRVQAEAADALRAQLEQLTSDYNFALQRKYAFPAAVQVVEEVTKLLPDDTWLTQFEIRTVGRGKDSRRELLLRGESGNAGRLVTLLEESKQFEQAAPRSPTTKIQPGPGEIFDLGAQIKSLAPPQTVQLAQAAGAQVPPAPGANAGGGGPPAAAPPPGAPAASGTNASMPASGGVPTGAPAPPATPTGTSAPPGPGTPARPTSAAPAPGPGQPANPAAAPGAPARPPAGAAAPGAATGGDARPVPTAVAPAGMTNAQPVPDIPDSY